MCGLCGALDPRCQTHRDELVAIVTAMADSLSHRGPDESGSWVDEEQGVSLGHRRLSILDLSIEGSQPMRSRSGRFVIAFNGEIYNWRQLREELETRGHGFCGHSDTEVLLASVSEWGLLPAVQRFVGMFAFALWDRAERVLHLCRDRLGEKPLYYGWCGPVLLFGSELKAFRRHPDWSGEIDRDSLELLLRHNYIPAPYSIYRNVRKLLPGTILSIGAGSRPETAPTPLPYWSAAEAVSRGIANPFEGSDEEAAAELDGLLRQAIRDQMIADVPLGAFLSGGIDSSTVVGIMQAESKRPVKTFSIGFFDRAFDEADHARAVARHVGTDHTEHYASPRDALEVIPKLPQIHDEPFADPSEIPTLLVSQLARGEVTVSLSGDGGDELFGGYTRYLLGPRAWSRTRWMPSFARAHAARFLRRLPWDEYDRLSSRALQLASSRRHPPRLAETAEKAIDLLSARCADDVYRRLVTNGWNRPSMVVDAGDASTILTTPEEWPTIPKDAERMMYLDAVSYLPDDILAKVDRAAMAVSLESRAPFLDHRVFEFAWRLPMSMKIRGRQTKWLLRQIAYRYVPAALLDRPKMGFGIPLGSWLRGPLRDWAESLLDENRLRVEGFLDAVAVRRSWAEHLSGRREHGWQLWSALMFQAWFEDSRQLSNE